MAIGLYLHYAALISVCAELSVMTVRCGTSRTLNLRMRGAVLAEQDMAEAVWP